MDNQTSGCYCDTAPLQATRMDLATGTLSRLCSLLSPPPPIPFPPPLSKIPQPPPSRPPPPSLPLEVGAWALGWSLVDFQAARCWGGARRGLLPLAPDPHPTPLQSDRPRFKFPGRRARARNTLDAKSLAVPTAAASPGPTRPGPPSRRLSPQAAPRPPAVSEHASGP
jgi:hypothetical protein